MDGVEQMQRVAIGLVMSLVVACGGDDSGADEGAGSGAESSSGGTQAESEEGADSESSSAGGPALPPTCADLEDFLLLGSFVGTRDPDEVCGDSGSDPLAPAGTYGLDLLGEYWVCAAEMSPFAVAEPNNGDATGAIQASYLGAFRYHDATDPNDGDPHYVTVMIADYGWVWAVGCDSSQWKYDPLDQENVHTDDMQVGDALCRTTPIAVVDTSDPSRVALSLGNQTCTLELHAI
jgi:hypothetical protein